jgi:putative phosphoribosyl transferase
MMKEHETQSTWREVRITLDDAVLEGNLNVPEDAQGIVLFAHGSGSSRFSPRNNFVADILHQGQIGTLLFDLLTPQEDDIDQHTRQLRFDIGLLADRLIGATGWLMQQSGFEETPIGYFGASTGGGAALVAAAAHPDTIGAVVSRGGRPDLAGIALRHVEAPTLLIVGGDDYPVIQMNQAAMAQMQAPVQLEIIPGASHLFEEPGTMHQAALLARDFFQKHLHPTLDEAA